MIEKALYEHLISQADLAAVLTTYNEEPAIFNMKAPADTDTGWAGGPKYGRIVFDVDLQGDPARCLGGTLMVDIMCEEDDPFLEDIERLIRSLIHGYFFSNGTFTVAAQWRGSTRFREPDNNVIGYTASFELLGFPVLTTFSPDVIERINAFCGEFENLHIINHDALPATAWKPTGDESAVYWRLVQENPSPWYQDTYATIWRTATIKGHIFSRDNATAAAVARDIATQLLTAKRLKKPGEQSIIIGKRAPSIDYGADPLRTGQITVEGTYGVLRHYVNEKTVDHIKYTEKREETP